jgi:hypothetical protein
MSKHVIGDGSSYDTDMTLIESFVRCKNNPNDQLAQSAVFNYYISQALNYWGKYQELPLRTTKTEITYSMLPNYKLYQMTNSEKILHETKLKNEENKLLTLINTATNNFNSQSKVDIKDIFNIFLYLSQLFCEYIDPEMRNISMNEKSINWETFLRERLYDNIFNNGEYSIANNVSVFPLTNNNGEFALNTYLYAFFNDIALFGIPYEMGSFDGAHGCPLFFINHDIRHVEYQIEEGITLPNNHSLTKRIYHNILNDNLSKNHKELLIFYIWSNIHEVGILPFDKYFVPPNTYDLTEFIAIVSNNNYEIFGDFNVTDEIRKVYGSLSDDDINNTFNTFPMLRSLIDNALEELRTAILETFKNADSANTSYHYESVKINEYLILSFYCINFCLSRYIVNGPVNYI